MEAQLQADLEQIEGYLKKPSFKQLKGVDQLSVHFIYYLRSNNQALISQTINLLLPKILEHFILLH